MLPEENVYVGDESTQALYTDYVLHTIARDSDAGLQVLVH
jgi:hypothetical protein